MNQANEAQINKEDISPTESLDKTQEHGTIPHIQGIQGFFDVVDTEPSHTPRTFWDSFKIYKNGATKRFYYYDYKNREWDYIVAT